MLSNPDNAIATEWMAEVKRATDSLVALGVPAIDVRIEVDEDEVWGSISLEFSVYGHRSETQAERKQRASDSRQKAMNRSAEIVKEIARLKKEFADLVLD